jgi:hypothetical protein
MATLAELIRGFTPPTESALADPIKQHFKTLPAQTVANLAKQRQNIDESLALDQNGIQVANPQAFNEFMAEVPNAAGIFIGPESKLWNKENAYKAAQMLKKDVPAEEVWKATGTAKGLDNQFRQEISDAEMAFNDPAYGQFRRMREFLGQEQPRKHSMSLYDLVSHEQLKKSYPESSDIGVYRGGIEGGGSSSPIAWDVVTLGVPAWEGKTGSKKAMENTLIHELQHQVQEHEGFAKGGDTGLFKELTPPKEILNKLQTLKARYEKLPGGSEERNKLVNQYFDMAGKYTPYGQYKNLAGEAEARLAANRQKLTEQQRKDIFPFKQQKYGLDVNPDDLLIRNYDKPIITRKQMLEDLLIKK